MNLDKKLELAHEYAIAMIMGKIGKESAEKFAITAFDLADAMEAEYNKRKRKQEIEDVSQDVGLFEHRMSESSQYSGESKRFSKYLKNVDGSCKHVRKTLDSSACFDCAEDLNPSISMELEWQPDWSVAPKWANWWAMDGDCCCYWHSCVDSPFINSGIFEIANPQGHTSDAPLFNYQGDWKDSLRKRPDGRPKQHDCNCAHWKGSSFFMGDTFTCKDCGGSVTI